VGVGEKWLTVLAVVKFETKKLEIFEKEQV